MDGFIQKLNCDLVKHWFSRSELYRNIPKDLKQTLGEPLTEEQLRIAYAKGNLPKIYCMNLNNNQNQRKQKNTSEHSLEKEESHSSSSSTTISEKKSVLSFPDDTISHSQGSLNNNTNTRINSAHVKAKTGLKAKTSKNLLSKLKNVSKLILPSKILETNILPSRLRHKNL